MPLRLMEAMLLQICEVENIYCGSGKREEAGKCGQNVGALEWRAFSRWDRRHVTQIQKYMRQYMARGR